MAALHGHDRARAEQVLFDRLLPLFVPLQAGADKLMAFQTDSAREAFDASQARYRSFRALTIGGLVASFLLAALSARSLIRATMLPVEDALRHFDAIARGDLTTRMEVRSNDEKGRLLQGVAHAGVADAHRAQHPPGMHRDRHGVGRDRGRDRGPGRAHRATGRRAGRDDGIDRLVDVDRGAECGQRHAGRGHDGRHLRGFAVVAAEVRTLARRSAAAAREIKTLIDDSVQKVEAGATITDVVAGVARVTAIMADIAAATSAQSTGIEQVGDAIGRMDRVTQQNATLVEEAAAAVQSLRDQAAMLAQAVVRFKVGTAPFTAR